MNIKIYLFVFFLFIHILTHSKTLFAQDQPGSKSIEELYNKGFNDTTQITSILNTIQSFTLFTPKEVNIFKQAIEYSDSLHFFRGSLQLRYQLIHHYYLNREQDSALLYYHYVEEFIKSTNTNNDQYSFLYSRMGNHYLSQGDINKGFTYLRLALDKHLKFNKNPSWLYNVIGEAYNSISEYDSAIVYYSHAIDHGYLNQDTIDLADALNGISIIYYRQGNFNQSVNYLLDALNLYEIKKDSFGISLVHNNLANNYKDLKNYQKSLAYYRSSLELYKRFDYNQGIANSYNNIALVLYEQKKLDSSLIMQDKALQLRLELGNLKDISDSYSNTGIVHFEKKELDRAIELYQKALKIKISIQDKQGEAMCLLNLSQAYSEKNDRKKTIHFAERALPIIKEIHALTLEKDLYENLYLYFKRINSPNMALKYSQLLLDTKDELMYDEMTNHIDALKSQQKLQVQERKVDVLKRDKAYQELLLAHKNKELENEKLAKYGLLGGVSILLIAGLLLSLSYRRNISITKALQEQQKQLEQKNQAILSSREYATSMEKMLIQQMNPHFIFNALTTVQAFIETNSTQSANIYIHTFSLLMRKMLDHSRTECIGLEEEIEFLKLYIKMHLLKNPDEIEVRFEYNEDEVGDFVYTPPMLIQPFIENAFVHGLKHKTNGKKKLNIEIEVLEEHIEWIIEDNGIGRKLSASIEKSHKNISHGTNITNDRINWMKNLYKGQFSIRYEDYNSPTGTKVVITTPIVPPPC